MMNKKTLRNDLILISSLLVVAVVSLIIILLTRTKNNLVAKVMVQNEVVLTIDLNKENNKDFYILDNKIHIHVKDGGIAIVESNCPHQDCVNMGYVYESGKPIICAYNAVSIVIEGNSNYDVEVG